MSRLVLLLPLQTECNLLMRQQSRSTLYGVSRNGPVNKCQACSQVWLASPEQVVDECRFWEHHWVWWTAPFVGAFLAAKLYAKYVMPKDQLKELRTEAGTA